MYNEEIKRRFLENYPNNSQHFYQSVFKQAEVIEEMLGKDLYQFHIHEIQEVMKHLRAYRTSTARSYGRIISAYLAWAINEGLRDDGINPLENVQNTFFEQFLDETSLLPFITYDQLEIIEGFCENSQDAVIIRMLFEGIQGRENSEIRNLKIKDVDFDSNTLHLTDEKGQKRKLIVSDECIKLIEQAAGESTYYKRNGMMEETSNVRGFTDLVDNEYIIRSSITRTNTLNEPVDKYVILRRIASISELMAIPHLNAKNIARSGMIYMGYKLLNEHGEIDDTTYKEIAERYKVNNIYALKEVVNENVINKLYSEIE